MQISDINNPQERKKLILAVGLGVIALIFLWWTFIGFGGSTPPKPVQRTSNQGPPSNGRPTTTTRPQRPEDSQVSLANLGPLPQLRVPPPVGDPKRNIFAYVEKPVQVVASVPTPTPTPTPPVLLAALSPSNVYARTADFTLEVTGDKFTHELRINIDGRELPTRFSGPQQLSATVPASMIASAGTREVVVKSSDGKIYSNSAMLNVGAPPTPNYTYIGIIQPRRQPEIAILQDKGNREVLNAQRGDVLGGRFRLTSISLSELVFVDTNLKIKHTLPFSTERDRGIGPQSRPTPRVDSEDDEP